MLFCNRADAGRQLAAKLTKFAERSDVTVLALPRGGVPVAFEVAKRLHAPLDVFLVRKLGMPGHRELAIGAIASGGIRVLNEELMAALKMSEDLLDAITKREQQELDRRERLYRGDRPPPEVCGRTVILVDDGLATGTTMRAAIAALRRLNPAHIVAAVPVGSAETCAEFQNEAICARTPEPFYSIGLWYGDFSQTTDAEVRALLTKANQASEIAAHQG